MHTLEDRSNTVVTRVYSEDDMREAIRLAYEDAARIVMEPRGTSPLGALTAMAERILSRGDGFGVPGQAALPIERLTAHARNLPIPNTAAEAKKIGVMRSNHG